MSDLKLSHLMTDSSLAPALKPAFPKLFAGTLAARVMSAAIKNAVMNSKISDEEFLSMVK